MRVWIEEAPQPAPWQPSTDEELLREKVARAMWDDLNRRAGRDTPWEEAGPRVTQPHYREQAAAAINAMRADSTE